MLNLLKAGVAVLVIPALKFQIGFIMTTDKIQGGTINVEGNGFVKTGSTVKVRKAKLKTKQEKPIPNVYYVEYKLILKNGDIRSEKIKMAGTFEDTKKFATKYLQNYYKNSSFVMKDTTGVIVEQYTK